MMRYLGVMGYPISHSLSPVMHNRALEVQGLDYTYLPFEVKKEDLAKALQGFEALQVVGMNVTIPYKVELIDYLDQISPEAELIGAVNTIHYQAGQWTGYNTDGIGFLRSLQQDAGIDPMGAQILLLGAGGAARAVAVQLGLAGAQEIVIANRTVVKAEQLAEELNCKITQSRYRGIGMSEGELAWEMSQAQIVVNATPVGMVSQVEMNLPIQQEWIRPDQLIADLVYRPLMTPFLQTAEEAGARILTGAGMLLHQGAEAYRIWTGVEPPVEVMREALLKELTGEESYRFCDYRPEEEEEWLRCWAQVVVTSHAWTYILQSKPAYQKEALEMVVKVGGKVIGFIDVEIFDHLWGRPDEKIEPFGFVWEYGLLPEYRGHGLGRHLIEIAGQRLKTEYGVDRLEFWSQDSQSQDFYKKMGMDEISRHYQLFITPNTQLDALFQGGFHPREIAGTCALQDLEQVRKIYQVEEEHPFECHECIGYNYFVK